MVTTVHLLQWGQAATAAVAILALLATGPLRAQSADRDLAAGLQQVREGDFENAVVTLDAVARRLAGDKSRRRELLDAYLNLGVALVALDQRTAARDRFRLALALDPKLELRTDRYSPKVIGVFEEARREAAAEAASRETKAGAQPKAKSGGSKLPLVLLGAGGAAAAGVTVALATGGGDGARFTGARFGTRVVTCPNGAQGEELLVTILVDAVGGSGPTRINAVSVTLRIEESPALPEEVGIADSRTATITPASVPARASVSLQVDTTLLCSNATGGQPRFNVWSGHLTLSTASGPITLDAVDTLQVNIP